jgi:hypothetical protein
VPTHKPRKPCQPTPRFLCPEIRTQYGCHSIKCCTVCLEIRACLLRKFPEMCGCLSSSIFVPNSLKNSCSLFLDFCATLLLYGLLKIRTVRPQYLLYLPPRFVQQTCLGIHASSRKLASLLKLDFSLSLSCALSKSHEECQKRGASFPNSTQGGNVKSLMIQG